MKAIKAVQWTPYFNVARLLPFSGLIAFLNRVVLVSACIKNSATKLPLILAHAMLRHVIALQQLVRIHTQSAWLDCCGRTILHLILGNVL